MSQTTGVRQSFAPTALTWATLATPGGTASTPGNGGAGWAWGVGAWTELIGSAAGTIDLADVLTSATSSARTIRIAFGVGAAGAETVVGYLATTAGNSANHTRYRLSVPWRLATAGARIVARVEGYFDGAVSLRVGYYKGLESDHVLPTVSALTSSGVPVDNWGSIQIQPSNSAWAPTAWYECVAGAAEELALEALVYAFSEVDLGARELEFEFGTGAAGAEVGISRVRVADLRTTYGIPAYQARLPYPHPIAASTRIAVRLRSSGTNGSGLAFSAALNYWAPTTFLSITRECGLLQIGLVPGAASLSFPSGVDLQLGLPTIGLVPEEASLSVSGEAELQLGLPRIGLDIPEASITVTEPTIVTYGLELLMIGLKLLSPTRLFPLGLRRKGHRCADDLTEGPKRETPGDVPENTVD